MNPRATLQQDARTPWKKTGIAPWAKPKPAKNTRDLLRRFGFYCAVALVFIRFSFASDFLTYLTGSETYMLYVFGLPAMAALLGSGGFQRVFRERAPKFWLGFVACMCLSIPLSVWKGGSISLTLEYVKTVFILVVFVVGLTVNWSECEKVMQAVAVAAAFNVVVALYFLRPGEERFSFTWTTSIGNSNDYAGHLLMVLPFLLFWALRPGGRKWVRMACAGLVCLGLFEILRTASRGALIALSLVVLILLFRGTMRQRIAIGATAIVVLAAMVALLPRDTWNRMLSFSTEETGASEEALESSTIRTDLLKESIVCTLEHPVLGVGAGQFGMYEAMQGKSYGHYGWLQAHNSYMEISSECGLPALALYLAALIWAFILLRRIAKQASGPDKEEMKTATYAITVAIIGYSAAVLFLNFAYAFEFVVVSSLVECMWRALRDSTDVGNGTESGMTKTVSAPWGTATPKRGRWKRRPTEAP
jgi:O-antigen ligase